MPDGNATFAAIALRKLTTAARLPFRSVALVAAVWTLLWPARLVALAVPTRILSKLLGKDRGTDITVPAIDAAQLASARRLAGAFEIAVRYSPTSANCYPQALVAHLLLGIRGVGHALFFGLCRSKDTDELRAHAWVMAGDLAVCGGKGRDDYTVVRSFVSG